MTQRRWGHIAVLLACHGVAASVYFVAFLVVPGVIAGMLMVIAIIGALITGDAGGPLFFPMVFIFGIMYLIHIVIEGLAFFLICAVLQFLRCRVRIPWWPPVVLAFLIAFVIPALFNWDNILYSLFICAGFCTYWISLSGSEAIVTWIRRRFKGGERPSPAG